MTVKLPSYYATEKDIFDCLMSAKQKFPNDVLVELCRNRGIFVSEDEPRPALAKYISMLPHSFLQFQEIANHVESASRADKVSSVVIPTSVSKVEIGQAVGALKDSCEQTGETITLTHDGKKSILKVAYSEIDYSKTVMRQRRNRECFIEIEDNGTSLAIRKPVNDKVDEIFSAFMMKLEETKQQEIVPDAIDLSSVKSPDLINEFFTILIKQIDGFTFHDVTSVKVNNKDAKNTKEDEDDVEEEKLEAEEDMLVFIKRAALDGGGLLNSEDYKRLIQKGFYTSNIVWHSILQKPHQPKVEFEAMLGNPGEGSGFKYSVRGVYNWKQDHHTQTRRPVPDGDKASYLESLEQAARKAFSMIKAKFP